MYPKHNICSDITCNRNCTAASTTSCDNFNSNSSVSSSSTSCLSITSNSDCSKSSSYSVLTSYDSKSIECKTTKGHKFTCDEKVLGKKKFCVKFDDKKGHRFEEEITGNCTIHVNGKNAPILKVKRGYIYYFAVEQKKSNGIYENLFVLTKSPVGYYNGQKPIPLTGSFDPVGNGYVKYFVGKNTPKYFYYQSSINAFLGNLVIVE